jgi:predicted dehydrogenase
LQEFSIKTQFMLKIGLFGVGHLGKIHLSQLTTMKDVEVTGFFDPSDDNASGVHEQYEIKRFDSAEELIMASDAIDIVAPTTQHFKLCEMAIRNGKHVFVEKPMTNTMEEAKLLVKLVEEANIKFQVGHVERFNPAFLALKGVDLNPMFIEVHRLAEFNPRGTDVSVILDTPDIANVRIEFHNGCVANLTSSRISLKKMRKMRLFQKDAYIGIDFLDKKTEIIKLKTPADEGLFTLDIATNNGKKTIAIANPEIKQSNAIRMELELFRDAILENKPVPVNVIDGFQALEAAHQILQKIGKGQQQPAE